MALPNTRICAPGFVIPTESRMMLKFFAAVGFVAASFVMHNPIAEAAIVVQITDATIDSGGTGSVDVVVTGSNDPLSIFDFQFVITPIGSVGSAMRFIDPQPDTQLSDPDYSMSYVFAGISDNVKNGSPMGSVSGGTTFNGSDETADRSNVIVSSDRLLARLGLESVVPEGGDAMGDQFEITLTAANFLNSNGNSVTFSTSPGFVTVVPEPGSFAVLAVALGLLLCRNRVAGVKARKGATGSLTRRIGSKTEF